MPSGISFSGRILLCLNNLCDPPISSIIDSCVYRTSNASLIIHLIVDVYEYPPLLGRSPFSIHFRNRLPPVFSRCFIDNSDTHFGIVTATDHVGRSRCFIYCCYGRCYPILRCRQSKLSYRGGATDLTRFIHIAYSSLGEMFQGCVIFDCRIFVARVNGTSNATTTDVLRLDSTERQRSFQNRLHRRNGS